MSKKNHCMGSDHWNWNEGRTTYNGYSAILSPDHPFKNKRGYVYEHRLIMEKEIGRFLQPNERVHHINGDKTDNKLKNLIILSHRAHRRIHSNPKAKWELLKNREWLKKQIKNGKSANQIATIVGCTDAPVRIALDKYNIRKIVPGPIPQKFPILRDKQWLTEKTKTMTPTMIAKLLGCDRRLIYKFQEIHNIKPSRKPKTA